MAIITLQCLQCRAIGPALEGASSDHDTAVVCVVIPHTPAFHFVANHDAACASARDTVSADAFSFGENYEKETT